MKRMSLVQPLIDAGFDDESIQLAKAVYVINFGDGDIINTDFEGNPAKLEFISIADMLKKRRKRKLSTHQSS